MSYFLGNILVEVSVTFLPDYPLVLFLLKHRDIGVFLNKKNDKFKQENSLNNSLDNYKIVKTRVN